MEVVKMAIEMKAMSTCSSVGSNEEDQVTLPNEEDQVTSPVSQHPGSLEVENSHKLYPPSPLLSAPVRICDTEEDEQLDDVLVELGCRCKGELSRMHRKCILKWYSLRKLWQNNYKAVPTGTRAVVTEAVSDHENGGRAVLMATLKSQLAGFPWMPDLETAGDYDELVMLLAAQKAEFFTRWEAGTAYGEVRVRPRPPGCTWQTGLGMGIVAALVGGYAYVLYHFFGSTLHH